MLSVDVLDLHAVELRQIVELENVEDPLQGPVK